MKYTILFKEVVGDVFKGEKQELYDSYEDAEKDAKRIASILNEISDEKVTYEIIPSDNPEDIMLHRDNRQRQRPTYHYFYTEEVHEPGFDGLTTYEVPDLNIKITAENMAGIGMLREAARLQLEYLVNDFEMGERPFPKSRKDGEYPSHITTGMLSVTLNPVIESKKQRLGME